ncbi:metal ABC transporter permease [Desulfotruncus alcoholivorax]|uniref:metal ABC transporter permease n=1 Tax=Desulfotruncus alcoholivorax TaxID=265477 RepID=UPI0003F7A3EE|nr:metal ABC transporter permease [Desulfotruncus alcoholivorax]
MNMLAYDFMQRAIIAGILVGIICSFVAFFVVLKRLSFAGVGISHSALGGVALGVLLGFNPILAGGIFATVIAWLIGFVSRRGEIEEDVTIGIFFSAAMAFGITVMGMTSGYYADLFSFLFGNILAVSNQDLLILASVGGIVLVSLGLCFKGLLFLCFDEELAQVNGVPVKLLYYLLLTCIAITVVIAVKVVGIILASALLVIPAATAQELTGNFKWMLALSIMAGLISSLGGLCLSYYYDLPSGSTIVLTAGLLFLLAFALSPRRMHLHIFSRLLRRQESKSHGTQENRDKLPEKVAIH